MTPRSAKEETSKRVATIAGRILRMKRTRAVCLFEDGFKKLYRFAWSDIRALAASCLTQSPDHKEAATLRKGQLPKGHKLIKRGKPVKRRMLHK